MTNILFDPAGGVLQHNVLTDTIVLVVGLVFATWFCLAAAVSVPVLLAYAYLPLLLWLPVIVVILEMVFNEKKWDVEGEQWPIHLLNAIFSETKRKKLPGNAPAEVLATKLLIMRFVYITLFATLVFGVRLWPLYTGDASYADVLDDAVRGMGVSLSFWSPSWRVSFAWPFELPAVDQIALGSSVGGGDGGPLP